jgi:hypothetical protein
MPDVTGITALDVGLGLAFVYLLFSVLCSAVQEAIAGMLDLRAKTLEQGLRNLLDDHGLPNIAGAPKDVTLTPPAPTRPADATSLTDELLGHGLIRTQYRASRIPFRSNRRGPSYLSSKTVALALSTSPRPNPPAKVS